MGVCVSGVQIGLPISYSRLDGIREYETCIQVSVSNYRLKWVIQSGTGPPSICRGIGVICLMGLFVILRSIEENRGLCMRGRCLDRNDLFILQGAL